MKSAIAVAVVAAAIGALNASPPQKNPQAKHWAYITPVRPVPPMLKDSAGVQNPIDQFIRSRLEREGIKPSPEADKLTLLRRLCLDLLGLPPTPEQREAFLADKSPSAYERLVERLLQSPHYGERWARFWLDAARYADSDGYEKDTGRPHAWRWRDWVITAWNHDMPYDQFIIEQLAGDLLPDAGIDSKIATGFHRNTLTNNEGGVDKEQFRVEAVVDRVNTTASVFLGLSFGCAQCHDHKYDPFTQREYYQFFAFFNSADEVNLPLDPSQAEKVRQVQEMHKQELEAYKQIQPQEQPRWEATLSAADRKKLPADVLMAMKVPFSLRSPEQAKLVYNFYVGNDPVLIALEKRQAEQLRKLQGSQAIAPTMQEGKGRKTHILQRGDFLRPGAEVEPGVPAVLGSPASPMRNRVDLAKWIASPTNPLTARVFVNWVWQKHFGRGIVATLEDFGVQGQRPTHPELLDWLATEFVRLRWNIKELHRLIVTSATYRQSSAGRPELQDRDPLNTLLSRQNRLRLEAEIIRDCALASSGLLAAAVGGPSVRPPQPAGISDLTYAGAAKWVESTGPDRYRRGLYIWFQRTSPFPMLMTFDAPDANVFCVKRERSNTPLQALTLLNDVTFVECAQALGKRLAEAPGNSASKVALGMQLCLGREPTSIENARYIQFYNEFRSLAMGTPDEAMKLVGKFKPVTGNIGDAAAWVGVARLMMNLDEFVTRE